MKSLALIIITATLLFLPLQMQKPVVVVKGKVIFADSTPAPAVVSIRAVSDTAQEITSSRVNSETGQYLVVLKPERKYWLLIDGQRIHNRDTLIETPRIEKTLQIVQDFIVERK